MTSQTPILMLTAQAARPPTASQGSKPASTITLPKPFEPK